MWISFLIQRSNRFPLVIFNGIPFTKVNCLALASDAADCIYVILMPYQSMLVAGWDHWWFSLDCVRLSVPKHHLIWLLPCCEVLASCYQDTFAVLQTDCFLIGKYDALWGIYVDFFPYMSLEIKLQNHFGLVITHKINLGWSFYFTQWSWCLILFHFSGKLNLFNLFLINLNLFRNITLCCLVLQFFLWRLYRCDYNLRILTTH